MIKTIEEKHGKVCFTKALQDKNGLHGSRRIYTLRAADPKVKPIPRYVVTKGRLPDDGIFRSTIAMLLLSPPWTHPFRMPNYGHKSCTVDAGSVASVRHGDPANHWKQRR